MLFLFLFGVLSVNFVFCENTYKAAVITSNEYTRHSGFINDVSHLNADILVLPSPKTPLDGAFAELDDYDEVTKSTSALAKKIGAYVVAHLHEKSLCQNKREIIRSNLVFDRQGALVAVYRKSLNPLANCSISNHIPSFATDFGVSFGLLMEEDLALQNPELLKLKNFVVVGRSSSEVPFLSGSQFASSWAYVKNANLLTGNGVYTGRSGLKSGADQSDQVSIVKLNKNGGSAADIKYTTSSSSLPGFPMEDLNQYIIRPLDMRATVQGHSETVCHGEFCCEFYVKTSYVGSPQHEVSYGLAAFDGVRHFERGHYIGAQSCSIVACAGLYKRSCALGPNNSTNTYFEKVTVTGNFTKSNSAQFPLIVTTSETQKINFKTENSRKTTISIENGSNLLNFGIFGRVFSRDIESVYKTDTVENVNYYDYFFNEDVLEFFDYVWIRLRVLIFIVSIYVLEML